MNSDVKKKPLEWLSERCPNYYRCHYINMMSGSDLLEDVQISQVVWYERDI